MSGASYFLAGALAAGYLVIGTFFMRFWKRTADRLFIFFALAFVLLAVQRIILVFAPDIETAAFSLRALAFLVIIFAILDKNRR